MCRPELHLVTPRQVRRLCDGGRPASFLCDEDGYGLCAMARTAQARDVGVDLEPNRPLLPEWYRYFLSQDEQDRLLESGAERAPTALALWTVKEAVLKAARTSPCVTMRQVRVWWNDSGTLTVRLAALSGADVRMATWERRRGQVWAYATCRPVGGR